MLFSTFGDGSFVSVNLDKSTKEFLQKMSNGTNNKCFNCGKVGHFTKDCQTTDSDETNSDDDVLVCNCGQEFKEIKWCHHKKYCKAYKLYLKHNHSDLHCWNIVMTFTFFIKKTIRFVICILGSIWGNGIQKQQAFFVIKSKFIYFIL